jgi:hypothetical protein
VWNPGFCAPRGQAAYRYWATAADISINGGPWFGFYWSNPNWWTAASC